MPVLQQVQYCKRNAVDQEFVKGKDEAEMRNHEVTNVQLLLDEKGELREPGWSRSLVQKYRRSDIKDVMCFAEKVHNRY